MSTPAPRRPPVIPLVETTMWRGRELDIHTVDRGVDHAFILTNLYVDGQLLVTRRVPYVTSWDAERIRAMMQHHQTRLVSEVKSGSLDGELGTLFEGVSWAAPGAPTEAKAQPLPPPVYAPLVETAAPSTNLYRNLPTPTSHGLTPTTHVLTPSTPISSDVMAPLPTAGQALTPTGPPLLCVVLQEPAALMPLLFSQGKGRGIKVDTLENVELGTRVDVAVRFLGRPIHQFYVSGTVTARQRSSDGGQVAVSMGPTDQSGLDRVVDFARGIFDPATDRRSPRARCAIQATVVPTGGRMQPGRILNISEGGLMMGRMPPLMEGMRASITFTSPLRMTMTLAAQVRWFRADGEPLTGMEFVHDAQSRGQVADLVAELLKKQ